MYKIRTWFYNHYDCPHHQLIKFTWRWSAHNTFYHKNKKDIMEPMEQISESVPRSPAFLSALQDATTTLWKELLDEDKDINADHAKEWSENKPSADIQAK
jgi:hypothetical protein